MRDRSRDVSHELTEVRTVLSRAISALDQLDWLAEVDRTQYGDHFAPEPDEDIEDMAAALVQCVELLARWRKNGRPRRAK